MYLAEIIFFRVNRSLTSHQQRDQTETGPRFKVLSERPEERGIDLAIRGLVAHYPLHYRRTCFLSKQKLFTVIIIGTTIVHFET